MSSSVRRGQSIVRIADGVGFVTSALGRASQRGRAEWDRRVTWGVPGKYQHPCFLGASYARWVRTGSFLTGSRVWIGHDNVYVRTVVAGAIVATVEHHPQMDLEMIDALQAWYRGR